MDGTALKDQYPPSDMAGSAPGWLAVNEVSARMLIGRISSTKYTDPGTGLRYSTKLGGSGQYHMLDVAVFLDKVYRLSRTDEPRAVDAVYQFLDDCLLDGDLSACDAALKSVRAENIPLSVIISFLIVTRRAKPQLQAREGFFTRTVDHLSDKPESAEGVRALQKYR